MPVSSCAIGLCPITAVQRLTSVWVRRAVSAVAWRRCRLVCHWLQDHLLLTSRPRTGEPETWHDMVPQSMIPMLSPGSSASRAPLRRPPGSGSSRAVRCSRAGPGNGCVSSVVDLHPGGLALWPSHAWYCLHPTIPGPVPSWPCRAPDDLCTRGIPSTGQAPHVAQRRTRSICRLTRAPRIQGRLRWKSMWRLAARSGPCAVGECLFRNSRTNPM